MLCYVLSGASRISYTPESFAETIGSVKGLYGLKYTAPDLFEMKAIEHLCPGEIHLYSGYDEIALPALAAGVKGLIGTNYNFMPEPFLELCSRFREGRREEALKLSEELTAALRQLQEVGNSVRWAKAGCKLRGFDLGPPRQPIHAATDAEEARGRAVLERFGLGRV